jgi:hypothetical protein
VTHKQDIIILFSTVIISPEVEKHLQRDKSHLATVSNRSMAKKGFKMATLTNERSPNQQAFSKACELRCEKRPARKTPNHRLLKGKDDFFFASWLALKRVREG